MLNWQQATVTLDFSIEEAIKVLDKGALRSVFILDSDSKLLGIVTDGDVRRALLQHVPLSDNVEVIMNSSPIVAHVNESKEVVASMMRDHDHLTIPLVDDDMRMMGIETLQNMLNKPNFENTVVLMAGGMGSRLRPLTNDCPKPLLKVGGKPLLEIIIDKFIEGGFSNFIISINYKGAMLRNHFGNGSQWGVNIDYIEENERLGTAGALSLIDKPKLPFIVMNGDLLTSLDVGELLDFHVSQKTIATMCVRKYEQKVPYGVVNFQKQRLLSVDEKPMQKMFVNAGIYVLDPIVLDGMQTEEYIDMNELFDELINQKLPVAVFPIREYWLDIGRAEDFETAHGAYQEFFC